MDSIFARCASKSSATANLALVALLGFNASYLVHAQLAVAQTGAEPVDQAYVEPSKLSPNAVRITIYRPANGQPTSVASLRVNDHYHTSLRFGGYSEICLPPGRINLAARMVRAGTPPQSYADSTTALSTKEGNNVYFRVDEDSDNRVVITPVIAEVALAELKNTRRQVHTASRVPHTIDCFPPEPLIVKQENITLGVDALFVFGKSDIKGLSAQGRASLDALIVRLQKEYGNHDGVQIQITGHADPLGNPVSNKRLSETRAQTIRSYMVQGGMNANNITGVGVGTEQPVISTCGTIASPEVIACNAPNRRVVIHVQVVAR